LSLLDCFHMVLRVAFLFPLYLRTYEVAIRKKLPHVQNIKAKFIAI